MKKVQTCLLSILLYCLLLTSVFAQIPQEPPNAKSPNAASLGLYGEIPVSYFTGVPNIEIPLYTLTSRDITVPISLSYHASGFRPDMHPGWVGMGWNLNGIGAISRNVKDAPDDYDNPNWPAYGASLGFYFNHSLLNTTGWNQTTYMQGIARTDKQTKDTEPDEFSFNFGSYGGTFYLDADGTWKVKCEKPLKVTFNGIFSDIPFTRNAQTYGNTKTFNGFTITTEDGTQYIFGVDTNAIEYDLDFFGQDSSTEEWMASSWYLTKIISPFGDQVTFTYERDDFINQMYIAVSSTSTIGKISDGGVLGNIPCSAFSGINASPNYYSSGRLISPVYLSQIQSASTIIKFKRSTTTELRYETPIQGSLSPNIYDSHLAGVSPPYTNFLSYLIVKAGSFYPNNLTALKWKKLDQITIAPVTGTTLKTFNLSYSNSSTERLTLLSVIELGSDLKSKPPFLFYYDTSVPLPGYFSNRTDHWGFYNCTYASLSDLSTYYSQRNASATCLYAGVLKKITYPTGGVTEFTYEPHYYGKQLQLDRSLPPTSVSKTLAGGLRIKKISSYDPSNESPKIEKEYFYVNNYVNTQNPDALESSGVLGGLFRYSFDYSLKGIDGKDTYRVSLFSSQSVLPGCVNAMGSHIGYSQVVEKNIDGSYTKYYFSNFDNGRTDQRADNTLQQSRTEYEPYTAADQERGKLTKVEQYNSSNIILSSRDIQYQAVPPKASAFVKSLKAKSFLICPNTQGGIVEEGTAYRLNYYSYLPTTESVTIFDQNGSNGVTTVKTNAYDNYRLQTSLTTTNSTGDLIVIDYKHPVQMAANESTGGIYTNMVAKNILAPIVEQTTKKNNSLISLTRNNYTQPYPDKYVVTSIESNSASNRAVETRMSITYDDQGNQVATAKPGGPTTCYIWGYGGEYMVAKIESMDYATVVSMLGGNTAVTAFRNNVAPTDASINSFLAPLRNNLSNAQLTTYTYTPLWGMTTMTDTNNQKTSYVYDAMGRLSIIKDHGGNITKQFNYNYIIK